MKKEMIGVVLSVLFSIFCFGYCFLIYSIKSGTKFYLIWAAGGFLFLGLAFFLHFHMWDKLPSVLQKIIAGVVILGILLFIVVEGLIISHYNEQGEANLDYIIVLGAQIKEKGPSAALKFRLDEAYEYLIENENTICIVSGGQGPNEPCTEAQGMYEYLVEKGIDSDRLCEVITKAQEERANGTQVLVVRMNKNKKFQKEQLTKDGYEEFVDFYREALKN